MIYKRERDSGDPYRNTIWGLIEQKIELGSTVRRCLTYIPDEIEPCASAIIVLGENGSKAEELMKDSGWVLLAENVPGKIILFFLEPEDGYWKIDDLYGQENSDVDYVTAVFNKCFEHSYYGIHESRIYLYGEGEGACMAHMAAMAEPSGYAGLVSVNSPDVREEYMQACGSDLCVNLYGFMDVSARKRIKKTEIPVPVWNISKNRDMVPVKALQYWIQAGELTQFDTTDGTEVLYGRSNDTEYPYNQEKAAYCVKSSLTADLPEEKSQLMKEIWRFFNRRRRCMGDPGGDLRLAADFNTDSFAHTYREEIGGWMREWIVYAPTGDAVSGDENSSRKLPLVLALHGYGCTGKIYAEGTDWHKLAVEKGFIVVLPTAVPGELESGIELPTESCIYAPSWNPLDWGDNIPDDYSFLRELIERVCQEYPIDRERIYVTGHSQGSLMTQMLALTMPDIFAAAAPCSGVLFQPVIERVMKISETKQGGAIPIWMFAGEEEQWLLEADPEETNATGRSIDLWCKRNQLPGKAEELFHDNWRQYRDRWWDLVYEDEQHQPMVRYTKVAYMPHATMPEMTRRIWDEFFSGWRRTDEGLQFRKRKERG